MRTQDTQCKASGQSLVEISLIIPVLLLIIIGTVDLGRAMQAYIGVGQAAREAARFGSTRGWDASGMTNTATTELQRSGLNPAGATITVRTADIGAAVRVSVSFSFQLVTTFWRAAPIIITTAVEMMVI